jgi:hypothetical protein
VIEHLPRSLGFFLIVFSVTFTTIVDLQTIWVTAEDFWVLVLYEPVWDRRSKAFLSKTGAVVSSVYQMTEQCPKKTCFVFAMDYLEVS